MYEFLAYRVLDVMTPDPVTVLLEDPLSKVEEILESRDWNGLPVVDADGVLQGFATQLDVLRAFRFTQDSVFPPYEKIMSEPVSSVMSRDIERVRPRTPLTRVLERMVDLHRKSFPVVDDGRLVGIVAREDILEGLRRAAAGEKASGPI